jgi:hypothetical protein
MKTNTATHALSVRLIKRTPFAKCIAECGDILTQVLRYVILFSEQADIESDTSILGLWAVRSMRKKSLSLSLSLSVDHRQGREPIFFREKSSREKLSWSNGKRPSNGAKSESRSRGMIECAKKLDHFSVATCCEDVYLFGHVYAEMSGYVLIQSALVFTETKNKFKFPLYLASHRLTMSRILTNKPSNAHQTKLNTLSLRSRVKKKDIPEDFFSNKKSHENRMKDIRCC